MNKDLTPFLKSVEKKLNNMTTLEMVEWLENGAQELGQNGLKMLYDKLRQKFSELQDKVENNLGLFKHMQHISQGHLDKLNRIREIVSDHQYEDISGVHLMEAIYEVLNE